MDKTADVIKEIGLLRDWLHRLESNAQAAAADGGVIPAIVLATIGESVTRLIYAAGMVNGAALSGDGIRNVAERPHARVKKQKIEDALRQSDLTAQVAERDDIEYGHHESLPRGEHVSRLRK